jgi:phosphohistidine swiveling domain-containing protein
MGEPKNRNDKYGTEAATKSVRAFHDGVRALVQKKLAESGGDWSSFVFDKSYDLVTAKELQTVEDAFLATGHKFDVSATISAKEQPNKYKPIAEIAISKGEKAEKGKKIDVGHGDNVVKGPKNVEGTARFIRTAEIVMDMLMNGVPENTIAIIDDSGGTLTAPILESFKAVICFGGTVRSHLGILTREYGIPCLMNAKVDGVADGDRLELETSAVAKTAQDYQAGREAIAKIWKIA